MRIKGTPPDCTWNRGELMRTIQKRALIIAILFWLVDLHRAWAQVPAFPGADGAGANTSGGRGGIVYHVTVLDTKFSDTGPGTLHYGLNDANFGGAART